MKDSYIFLIKNDLNSLRGGGGGRARDILTALERG